MYKQNLTLNNLQGLVCYKAQTTNENQTKSETISISMLHDKLGESEQK